MKNKNVIKYTVRDLIEELKELPQNLPILTNGYESGYENISAIKIKNIKCVTNSPYYDGQFQENENNDENIFEVVVIEREERN